MEVWLFGVLCWQLPHIPQATTTEQHEAGGALKKHLRRLSYTPHNQPATMTEQHDCGESPQVENQ